MSYEVTAHRWTHGWELHIDGFGVTQSRTLAGAEEMVRDYLALDEVADAETAEIVVTPELEGGLAAEAHAAREETMRANAAVDAAAARSRRVVRDLKAAGLSGSDVATVLGLSVQRVSQLARS